MTGRQLLASLLTVALIAAACGSDEDSAAAATALPAGDASAFCLGWPAARAALQDDLGDTNNEWEIRGDVEVARLTLDEADARVPAALRSDWTSATKFQDTVITLLEIVDYMPDRLPVQLIDAAFGVGGVEAAAAASAQSIESIDAWALKQCGDFCESWPRLDRALGWVGGGGGDTTESIVRGADLDRATIELATGLIPDAIRQNWDRAAALKLALIDLYESVEWGSVDHEAVRLEHLAVLGLTQDSFEGLIGRMGEVPPETDHLWWISETRIVEETDPIEAWAAANCESIGIAGLPGTIRVEDPGGSVDMLLIAALPVGTDLGGVEDASDFLAVACSHVAPGEVWSSQLIDRNGGFDQPCVGLYRQDLGARPAVLAAGDYDLFVGSFPLGVGNFNTYVPAPEQCAVVPVTVDGDIEVAVPDLKPCDLGPLAGTAEEIARRQPPPDTGGPTGTLRVTLTEHLSDRGVHVNYRLVVLRAGTTLNQVAMGDAWPVGSACLGMDQPLEELLGNDRPEERQAEFDEEEREAGSQAEQRRTEREELERQEADLQAERQEIERQLDELGQLPAAQRAEAEQHVAESQAALEEAERQLADHRGQLEEAERHVEEQAAELQRQRDEFLSHVAPLREAIEGGGVPVPVLPFPADPTDEGCAGGGPYEYLGINDGWIEPELAVLPAGEYDVYVFVDLWNEEMGNESQQQCQKLTVSVSGETVVKAPPLEDCP